MKSFIKEFKTFAMRGNVMDLAIGVVIGAAFGKIVSSLVDNIMMPLLGVLNGGKSFADLSFQMGTTVVGYGKFIQSIVDFAIIAFAIFLVVKAMNNLKRKEVVTPSEPAAAPEDVQLLREIRDLLRSRQ